MKKTIIALAAGLYISPAPSRAEPPTGDHIERGVLGYWKLQGDCLDYSGDGLDGVNHGVNFSSTDAARFDGIDKFIEVPNTKRLNLGKRDFSVSVWIHTEAALTDVLGDVLSKFDPANRTGFTLSLMNYAGITTAQSNYRNLAFGIDAGHADKEWTDCGHPGNSKYVMALTVCEGELFAGTYEGGTNETGHVYRFDGGTNWTDCGFPDRANGVGSLASFRGQLYAGSTRYNARGSLMTPLLNNKPGGKIYRYDGGTKWTDCGKLDAVDAVGSLAVFEGKLFASSLYKDGKGLYRYDGETKWTYCGNPGRRTQPLTVFNGALYSGSPDAARFLRYEGHTNWTDLGNEPETTQMYSFVVYEGKLHFGNWPTGSVFSYDATANKWNSVGRLGRELEVMGVSVYNGMLYGGTLPLGKVYRYDAPNHWTFTGRLDNTPNTAYRRVWSMAVFQGKLFAGTLPAGRVYSFEAGKSATYDYELPAGWRHIAAVKAGGLLKLYVDGKLVANSSGFDPRDYDLSSSAPLRIGFGQHDYFNGKMKELRLHARALSDQEISALFQKENQQ